MGNIRCRAFRLIMTIFVSVKRRYNGSKTKYDKGNQNQVYRKISNIKRTKSQNLSVSRLGLQLSSHNILKPRVQWRMKM